MADDIREPTDGHEAPILDRERFWRRVGRIE
jgi:hypothetical protein